MSPTMVRCAYCGAPLVGDKGCPCAATAGYGAGRIAELEAQLHAKDEEIKKLRAELEKATRPQGNDKSDLSGLAAWEEG